MTVSRLDYHNAILCTICGHPRYFHRNTDGDGCRHNLKDYDGSLLRCGCYLFIPVSDEVPVKDSFL